MGDSFLCGMGTEFLALFRYILIIPILNGIQFGNEHVLNAGVFVTPVDSDRLFWHRVVMKDSCHVV
jgi:hypothetical protein